MMNRVNRFLFDTLRGRLILGVAVVHAVMMALFIADLTGRQRAMLLARQIEEATALSQTLATSAAGWIAAADISGLAEIVDAQRRYPELVFVMLVDKAGHVLADTDPGRRGLYLHDLPGEVRQTTLASSAVLVDVVTPAMIRGRHVGWARVGIGQEQVAKKLAAIIRDGVLYALATILVGSVVAWLMGRRITQRLYAVQETFAAVRAGNRQARALVVGGDEAAGMARDFNHMLDAMEEKDAELREKTEELDRYFTNALDLFCVAGIDGHFLRLNPEWETTLGFPVSELEGRRFLDLVHPDDLEATMAALSRLSEQQEVRDFVNRYRHRDGEYRWIEWRAFPADRQVVYAVARDITERMQAEEERLAHLRFFEAMDRVNRATQEALDLDTMMRDVLDVVLAVFDCDRAFLVFPCDPEAATWRVPMERTRPEYPGVWEPGLAMPMTAEVAATLRILLAAGGPVRFGPDGEYPLPADVAERFGFKSLLSMALSPKTGKPWQFGLHQCSFPRVWSKEDERLLRAIGRRLVDALTSLLAYRDLRESEEFLGNIVENIPNMIFVKEAEGLRFVRFNRAGEQLLGFSREELLGRNDYDFFPREEADFFTAKDREVLARKELIDIPEEPIQTRENEERILSTKKIPILDAAGNPRYLLGISEDITERKRAVEGIREREAFIRTMLDSVDEGFFVVDREYRLLSANRAFCEMVGLPEDLVVGQRCHEVSYRTDRPCFEQGGGCQECAAQRTFETGVPHAASHVRNGDDGSKRHVALKSFPIRDVSGQVISAIVTINDVTEKMKLEEQLAQSQKLEAIGRLAGGVAHDFNNMLTVITIQADLGLMKIKDSGQPLEGDLREIRKAADRSVNLTRQLLAFARKQTIAPKVLDLNETVEGMLKMLRRLIGEDIHLVWLAGSGTWPVLMDPSQIDQILANLCVNARDAITGVGNITIETRNAHIDEGYCLDHPEVLAGDYVLLEVCDTGCGMDRQTIAKIFEPFFTTKGRGRGTGLGLATVYGIVKQNNGFINVYSEPGRGTSFKLYLPRHAVEMERAEEAVLVAPNPWGNETVLVVEDEEAILSTTKTVLEEFGYRVLAASTPAEAIRLAREQGAAIKLLLTDVIMPEMNGSELAKKLAADHPELRCLFMSGYSSDVISRQGVLPEGVNFIEKPYTIQTLTAKVREVLDGRC